MLIGIGRIFISFIFIVLGVASIFNWDIVEMDFTGALANWEIYTESTEQMGNIFEIFLSLTTVILIFSIFLQILGGFFIFFGVKVRFGAMLLLIYLIPSTILHYPFWFLQKDALAHALVLFFKNLAIMGGVIVLLSIGKRKRRTVVAKKYPTTVEKN